MIKAVIFDLDDTLYFETDYVKSGFSAVAAALNNEQLGERLWALFVESPKNVYQRAGMTEEECQKSISIYRSHLPKIELSKSVVETLVVLRDRGYILGIITDGRPEGQWNKINALGIKEFVSHIIVTDELGGIEFRKPCPKAFELMKQFCDVEYGEMIYVGDNAKKDFIAPVMLGMKTCHYKSSGLYHSEQSSADYEILSLSELLKIL